MWAKVESSSVTRVYPRPTAITVGDINYPANIMSMWTASELEAIGIYEVVEDNTNLKNSNYYYNGNETFAYAAGTVTKSFGVATAKEMNNILWTAEETKPEGFSTGDIKQKGLKTERKESINKDAHSLLSQYDWYTLRAASGGTATPSAITTYQAAVRTAANSMCTQIDNAANVDALAALYVYNSEDPPTRPLGEWPDEPTV